MKVLLLQLEYLIIGGNYNIYQDTSKKVAIEQIQFALEIPKLKKQ